MSRVELLRRSVTEDYRHEAALALLTVVVALGLWLSGALAQVLPYAVLDPAEVVGVLPYADLLADVVTVGFLDRSLGAATPIALAALGGLVAEKSGVFNIGLEGFMIFGAVNAAAVAWLVSGGGSISQGALWAGILGAVVVSAIYSVLFAVLLIRYEADQIVAGLAVWFLGLGFGPFTAVVLWGSQSSPPIGRIAPLQIPFLADLPVVGRVLFDTSPLVMLTLLLVVAVWIVLYRTRYGYWLQAAGENPEALDTAGVNVTRVRYAAVIVSGAFAGLAGAVVSIGNSTSFVGGGLTMVDGRGWIGIVAYLFGNYNPVGAFAAAVLFGAADMLQIQLQTVGIEVSATLMGLLPYVAVIVVLSVYGRTRMPSALGDPYESED